MSTAPGFEEFKQKFGVNPIVLTGGIATGLNGGAMPILSLTNPGSFSGGIGGDPTTEGEYFAEYVPIPGGTLIDNQVGMYPFANQATAANAIIAQPLRISMLMICPARPGVNFATKLSVMQSLQQSLQKHNMMGGMYSVATPSAIYTDCLMTAMVDASTGQSAQAQFQWRLDFIKPLLTLQAARQTMNAAMSKIANGTPTNGQTSGRDLTVNQPGTNAGPSTIPASTGSAAAGTGQFLGVVE